MPDDQLDTTSDAPTVRSQRAKFATAKVTADSGNTERPLLSSHQVGITATQALQAKRTAEAAELAAKRTAEAAELAAKRAADAAELATKKAVASAAKKNSKAGTAAKKATNPPLHQMTSTSKTIRLIQTRALILNLRLTINQQMRNVLSNKSVQLSRKAPQVHSLLFDICHPGSEQETAKLAAWDSFVLDEDCPPDDEGDSSDVSMDLFDM
jgi:hypothetical protein